MTNPPRDSETAQQRNRDRSGEQCPTRSIELMAVVVRFRDRTDRCTIVPAECSDSVRETAWLSANVDAMVDLDACR